MIRIGIRIGLACSTVPKCYTILTNSPLLLIRPQESEECSMVNKLLNQRPILYHFRKDSELPSHQQGVPEVSRISDSMQNTIVNCPSRKQRLNTREVEFPDAALDPEEKIKPSSMWNPESPCFLSRVPFQSHPGRRGR
jgi:hypothetical protein